MAKGIVYQCSACGYETGKWMGKCPSCGEWNTIAEKEHEPAVNAAPAAAARALPLSEIAPDNARRTRTRMAELDRVLGGGLVRGSTVLLGGDPGIGKSTLLLQVCDALSDSGAVLYATGEESAAQIRLRAQRLGVQGKGLLVAAENDLDAIIAAAEKHACTTLVVDSIQTIYTARLPSAAGSITQVREATSALTRLAKRTGVAVIIVGHVTKEGNLAGPRMLEHLVDTVLYFEGDRTDSFRVLRAVKNRFGSTNEIGVFTMTERGMEEIADPSALFLPDRGRGLSGCAPLCVIEGSRPVMIELQALVTKTVFGMPRRMATGLDFNRLSLLIAVLEKKVGVNLSDQDAYINIVGGLRIDDRAADLAAAVALFSSWKDRPVPDGTAVLGEIGLTGEIRPVSAAARRAAECARLGFDRVILPKANRAGIVLPIEVIGVDTVGDAFRAVF